MIDREVTMNKCKLLRLAIVIPLLTLQLTGITLATSLNDFYTIVVIPDTQKYTQSYPQTFSAQTQWIVDNQDSENIVFVVHTGDIVNSSVYLGNTVTIVENERQWTIAREAIDILSDNSVPFTVLPGNHDIDAGANYNTYNHYFPHNESANESWYGGHFPEEGNENNYAFLSIKDDNFLILNIGLHPWNEEYGHSRQETFNWANDVISSHYDKRIIIVTHAYINNAGTKTNRFNADGVAIWENIVRKHSNIIAVICGHMEDERHKIDTGDKGNTIHNLLANYQRRDNGGDGWLRLYRFYPKDNRVQALTYSPTLDSYETDNNSQFAFGLTLACRSTITLEVEIIKVQPTGGGGSNGGEDPGEKEVLDGVDDIDSANITAGLAIFTEPTHISFGTIQLDKVVEKYATVSNIGTVEAEIEVKLNGLPSVFTSAFSTDNYTLVIQPGENATLILRLIIPESTDFMGLNEAAIEITAK